VLLLLLPTLILLKVQPRRVKKSQGRQTIQRSTL
jgi:hypothetical protein